MCSTKWRLRPVVAGDRTSLRRRKAGGRRCDRTRAARRLGCCGVAGNSSRRAQRQDVPTLLSCSVHVPLAGPSPT